MMPPSIDSTEAPPPSELVPPEEGPAVDEPQQDDDLDSALGSDSSSFTTSLTGNIDYRYEHGRRYHSYAEREYSLPNDEENKREMDRLEIQHLIWKELYDHELHLAPLPSDITAAIDVGCGTGNWTIEFADKYPDAKVYGTDLSAIQPVNVPPNLTFLVDDAAKMWSFGMQFDYVHTRAITMGIRDWDHLVQQAKDHLKPGGWLELQEMHFPILGVDETLTTDTALYKWSQEMIRGMAKVGLDAGSCRDHPQRMKAKGLVNVQFRAEQALLGPWQGGIKEKRVGALSLKDLMDGIDGISTKVLLMLGYAEPEIVTFLAKCKTELTSGKIHAYMPLYVVIDAVTRLDSSKPRCCKRLILK